MQRAPSFRPPSTPPTALPSVLGWVATLLLATVALAQAPPPDQPSIEDEIEVRLVELEVQVTDRRGEPIDGLGVEDFELLVDGEPVEIEHFEAPPTTSASAKVASDAEDKASEPLWLAIYVDRRFLQPGDLEDVKTYLGRFVTGELPANGRIMLVVAGGELDLKVAFTRSADEIVEALAGLDGEDTGYLLAEYRSVLADLQRRWNSGDEAFALDPRNNLDFRLQGGESDLDGGSGALDGNGPQGARFRGQRIDREPRAYVQQIDAFHRQLHGELQQAAAELQRTVQLLAGLSGRRHLLYVGNHVPTAASRTLFEAWREAFSRDDGRRDRSEDGGSGAPDQMLDSSRFDALTAGTRFETGGDLFTTLALDTSASGVVIHAVEASALRSRQYLGGVDLGQATFGQSAPETQSFATSVSLAAADGLQALTEATGGRLLQRSKNFDDFFTGLSRDLERPYVLGFTPDATVEPHEVEVRLRDRDDRRLRRADVRHPHAVRLPSRDQELAQRTVAALMLGDGLDNPLDVEIELGSPRLADDDASPGRLLPLTVRLPMSRLALVPDQQAHAGRLAIFATVGDLGGEIAPVSKTIVPVRVRNSDLLTALGRGVDVNLQLRLPDGARQVAVTVRDEFRPADSTLVASIAPPAVIAGDARPAEADAGE